LDEWASSTSGVKYISQIEELEMDGGSSLPIATKIDPDNFD
jgi:hypothetical protein